MENAEIARLFAETADLMEIAGEDGFRIRSYRNAASVIEGYPEQNLRYPRRSRAQGDRNSRHRQRHRGGSPGDRAARRLSNAAMRCCEISADARSSC